MSIQVGDKCSVSINGLLTRHYGVCVGHDRWGRPTFVHNTYRRGRVTVADVDDFAQGKAIRVDQRAPPGKGHAVARRAYALVGRKYDFVWFNCEHTANLAVSGISFSNQVAIGVGALVLAIFGVGAAVATRR